MVPYPDPCRQRRLTLSLVRRTVVAAELVSQTEPRQPSSPIGRACRPSDEFDAAGRASLRKPFRPGQGLSPARANSHPRSAQASHLAGLGPELSNQAAPSSPLLNVARPRRTAPYNLTFSGSTGPSLRHLGIRLDVHVPWQRLHAPVPHLVLVTHSAVVPCPFFATPDSSMHGTIQIVSCCHLSKLNGNS